MSGFTSFGGSSAATNPDISYETVGRDGAATGAGTQATGGNGVKGTYQAIGGAISNDWAGFYLFVGNVSNGTARLLIDISKDGTGAATVVPNLYCAIGAARWTRFFIPLKFSTGNTLGVKVQSSGSGHTVNMWARGLIASAANSPGFNNCEALFAADTSGSLPASNTVNATTNSATWTSLIDPTTRAYGAILMQVGTSTAAAAGQACVARLATGASGGGGETEVGNFAMRSSTSAPFITPHSDTFETTYASGVRLSAQVLAASAGTPDPHSIGLLGFYD